EIGGRMNIVNWMNPIIWNPVTHSFGTEPTGVVVKTELKPLPPNTDLTSEGALPYGYMGFNLAEAVEKRLGGKTAAEWLFIVISFDSKVVDGGVNGSAWLTRLSSLITGGTDKYFVDGLVNAIAGFVVGLMSPIVRAAQTGFTQNYALVMVIGLLVAVALYLVKIF